MRLLKGKRMKKSLFLLVLCLCMIWGSAHAAVSVRMDGGALLLREDGNEIVPMDVYEDIVALGNDLFAAQKDGLYLLLDGEGKARTEALYSDLRPAGDMFMACRDGSWGLLDASGAEIGAFAYEIIIMDESGHFWAMKTTGSRLMTEDVFLLDAAGTERNTAVQVGKLSDEAGEGMIAVYLPENALWGYMDAQGAMMIPARYSYAGAFACGRAAVVQDGRWGVIDAGGAWVVSPEYDALEISEAGFILAMQSGEGVYLLDMDGGEIAFHEGDENFACAVGNGYSLYDGRDLHLCDASGTVLETISRLGSVYAGLNGQWILSDGAWGENCVYLSGTEKKWQNIYPLGVAGEDALYVCMQVNVARYVSELLGEVQLAADMETARYGVIGADGEERIPCEYEIIEYPGNERLLLYGDGMWSMTDTQGRVYWSYGTKQSEEPSS